MATPTVRHLYVAAQSQGYKGDENNWQAMKDFCASLKDSAGKPDPLEFFVMPEDGSEIEIKELAFDTPPPRTKRRSVRIAGSVQNDDDREDGDAKFKAELNKAVDERMKQMGMDPLSKKRINPNDIGTVKDGEERMYEARIANKTAVFKSYGMALGFGRHIQHGFLMREGKHEQAQELFKNTAPILEARGLKLTTKGYTLTTTASGGALVPEGFDADLWQLILEYGVARRIARVVNMTSETVTRPKASGDLTVYYPADGSAGTESSKTFTNVQMRAKEGMVIAKTSKALIMDSAINVADDAGQDIVRAVAKVEDNSIFNSNGTGVAGGYIPGVQGILNIISETSTGARVFKSSATTPLGVTVSDVVALMATPGAFRGRMMAFHATTQVGAAVFQRLSSAVGGIQPTQIAGLGQVPTFLGAPIIYNNVMRTSIGTGSNAPLVVYGDISLAADFGDRMGLQVETSDQRYWEENNIGIKGTVRHDINVHGLGASTDTGPLAVLIQS